MGVLPHITLSCFVCNLNILHAVCSLIFFFHYVKVTNKPNVAGYAYCTIVVYVVSILVTIIKMKSISSKGTLYTSWNIYCQLHILWTNSYLQAVCWLVVSERYASTKFITRIFHVYWQKAIGTINSISNSGGRKWKHIFGHNGWVQNLHRKRTITEMNCVAHQCALHYAVINSNRFPWMAYMTWLVKWSDMSNLLLFLSVYVPRLGVQMCVSNFYHRS